MNILYLNTFCNSLRSCLFDFSIGRFSIWELKRNPNTSSLDPEMSTTSELPCSSLLEVFVMDVRLHIGTILEDIAHRFDQDASSISAALIGQQSWYDYFGLVPDSSYTNAILGAINGIYAAGGAFGCVFNMWSSEYFGRKRSIQIGCCISIVGATIMTASVAIPMFIVSRFVIRTMLLRSTLHGLTMI